MYYVTPFAKLMTFTFTRCKVCVQKSLNTEFTNGGKNINKIQANYIMSTIKEECMTGTKTVNLAQDLKLPRVCH